MTSTQPITLNQDVLSIIETYANIKIKKKVYKKKDAYYITSIKYKCENCDNYCKFNDINIIKNDYIINVLKDLPFIVARECMVLAYTILFEPLVLLETWRFIKLFPRMLKKRSYIISHAQVSAKTMKRWIT